MAFNMGTHHGTRQWINLEPCGLFCGCMTYLLIAFGMYATSYFVIIPWLGFSLHGLFHLVLFNAMSVLGGYSHFKAMTTDPGSVPKDARPLPDDQQEADYEAGEARTERYKKYCKRCRAFKPARAHHCSMCGRCIVKMDHHCPWVNNCVGVGNHKLFMLFIFWIFATCLYSMVLVAARYLACILGRDKEAPSCTGEVDAHLMVVFLLVESVLFGLFTLCMLGDQLSGITTNQTQIDRLKNTRHRPQAEVNEVFGTPAHLYCAAEWLYPAPVVFSEEMRPSVLGYVLDPSDSTSAEEELAPLMRAANASFTASSPLHPGYKPKSDSAAPGSDHSTSSSSSGVSKGATAMLNSRKRQQQRQQYARASADSDDSNFGTEAEESITEWLDEPVTERADGKGSVETTVAVSASGSASRIVPPTLTAVREESQESSSGVQSDGDTEKVDKISTSENTGVLPLSVTADMRKRA